MSWGISVNGHQDQQDNDAVEKLAKDVARLAKDAGVGVTYVNVNHGGGSKAILNTASGIDATSESDDDVAEGGDED